ncbi:MAG: ATP-dependent DNA helicase [Desulfurococcales archaeon]|nr:ATP-dependent DNA helicase [Desulfurococcales archaeon]
MSSPPRFPYSEYRRGQRELAEEIKSSIINGEVLVVRAPTGFGKTISVLYGALLAGAEKVLYLVRTVNEIEPVVRELKRLKASFTMLFSARRTCPLMSPGRSTIPLPPEDFWENCRLARARGVCEYYSRVEKLDLDDVKGVLNDPLASGPLRLAWGIAERLRACPFFSLRLLLEDSLFIVATYPYFFKRDIFEMVLEPLRYEDLVVIVDEAHTLMNAHSMLEYRIRAEDLEKALGEVKQYTQGYRRVEELITMLRRLAGRRVKRVEQLEKDEVSQVLSEVDYIVDTAEEVRERMVMEALAAGSPETLGRIRSYMARVANWALIASMKESHIFIEPGNGDSILVATPLDPAIIVKEPLERVKAAVLMSGTIPTRDFSREVLGIERSSRFLDVELLYGRFTPSGNIYTTVVADVTTRYVERTGYMYRRIASYLTFISRNMPGLKLAVYPSYEVMNGIVEKIPVDVDMLVEARGTSIDEVESRVRGDNSDLLINAVAGGKLVEGVEFTDYEGRNLLGIVIIVGVPFPQPDAYTKAQLDALAKRIGEGKAREYLYKHGTIIRVKQALGRAVRSPNDRAAYFLLDYRYLRRDIRELMNIRYDAVVKNLYGLAQAVRASVIHLKGNGES